MNFALKAVELSAAPVLKTNALVLLVGDGFTPGPDPLSLLIASACNSGDFKYDTGSVLSTWGNPQAQAQHLVLLGIGDGMPARVKKALHSISDLVKSAKFPSITFCFAQDVSALSLQAAVLAVRDCMYTYSATKTAHSKLEPSQIKSVTVAVPSLQDQQKTQLQEAFDNANAIAEGIDLAREWANRPANHATPDLLGQVAQALAQLPHISCEVMGPKAIAKLGMGAFLAVAQGSDQEPRFISLHYHGAPKTSAPVVLVGKGITFDSGGISLKPAADMDEMKFDMGGAASVLGTFMALSKLHPKINVVGLIPATENLPGGKAVKPGDVVRSLSGQTIEILNTDAEGRLILCDALTYAHHFEPRAIIDIATLTGACVIALGSVRTGMFASEASLAQALLEAGEKSLDLCWQMPLDDEYAEGLKTAFADVANVAGRQAGSVTAAKFLQRFVQPRYPWAHLDIAGTAWKGGGAQKGATGRPVALLVQYLLDTARQSEQSEQSEQEPKSKSPKSSSRGKKR